MAVACEQHETGRHSPLTREYGALEDAFAVCANAEHRVERHVIARPGRRLRRGMCLEHVRRVSTVLNMQQCEIWLRQPHPERLFSASDHRLGQRVLNLEIDGMVPERRLDLLEVHRPSVRNNAHSNLTLVWPSVLSREAPRLPLPAT